MNHHDSFYQFSKYGPDFLFRNLRIRDGKDEPYLPAKRKLISCEIKIKIFKKKNATKK